MLSYIPEPVANSPQAQPWVNQAREAVKANQSELHAFLSQRVDLASRAGTASGRELERFEHCLDIVTGRRPFVTARPLMLPFPRLPRSEEHTSELQSLMRISYAVFCLKKKTP